jgi:hypothetical protein
MGGSTVAWVHTQSMFLRWLKGLRDGNDLPCNFCQIVAEVGLVLRVLFEGYFRGSLADVARREGLGLKRLGWQQEIVLGAGKFTPLRKP